jgi:hypothetical protein
MDYRDCERVEGREKSKKRAKGRRGCFYLHREDS